MKVAAIIPAAGKGRRIKSKIDKPYIELCGRPILAHTLFRLSRNKYIKEIVVAVKKDKIGAVNKFGIKKVKVIEGGKERPDSVYNALKQVSKDIDYVLIHDGVRPFVNNSIINSSLKAARRFGASVVAVPVKPTLKYIDKNRRIRRTPDRKNYWEAQTPQVFRKDLIEKAYKVHPIPQGYGAGKCTPYHKGTGQASAPRTTRVRGRQEHKKIKITDDSMLVEQLGVKPKIVPGSYGNIKITTREDLELAKILIKRRV